MKRPAYGKERKRCWRGGEEVLKQRWHGPHLDTGEGRDCGLAFWRSGVWWCTELVDLVTDLCPEMNGLGRA